MKISADNNKLLKIGSPIVLLAIVAYIFKSGYAFGQWLHIITDNQ